MSGRQELQPSPRRVSVLLTSSGGGGASSAKRNSTANSASVSLCERIALTSACDSAPATLSSHHDVLTVSSANPESPLLTAGSFVLHSYLGPGNAHSFHASRSTHVPAFGAPLKHIACCNVILISHQRNDAVPFCLISLALAILPTLSLPHPFTQLLVCDLPPFLFRTTNPCEYAVPSPDLEFYICIRFNCFFSRFDMEGRMFLPFARPMPHIMLAVDCQSFCESMQRQKSSIEIQI